MSPVRVLIGGPEARERKADFFILESERVRLEDVHEAKPGLSLPRLFGERNVFNLNGVREDLENAISRFLESIDNVDGIVVVAERCEAGVLHTAVEALRDQCPRSRIELHIAEEVAGDASFAIELADCVVRAVQKREAQ